MDGTDAEDDGGDETDTRPGEPTTRAPLTAPLVRDLAASEPSVGDVEFAVPDGAEPPERLSSILVAVGGGPNSGAGVDLAREVADAGDAWLELFHVLPLAEDAAADEHTEADGDRLLTAAEDRLGGFDRVDRWLVEDETPAGAIVEQSPYYDAVVVGASTRSAVGKFVFGSTTETVLAGADVPVIVVEADGEAPLLAD